MSPEPRTPPSLPGSPSGLVVLLRPPRATQALLVAIAVAFAMTMIAGGPGDVRVLLNFGANLGPLVAAGDLWRLVASMFLHANILHLAVNGYALWVLGRNLEAFYGPWAFLFLFVASGVLGSVASAVGSGGISVGASGGIYGLLGASIVFAFRFRGILPKRVVRVMGTWLLPWVVLNVALGMLVPQIDLLAHLGGLMGGAILALGLRAPALEEAAGRESPTPRILASFTIALLAVSMVSAGENLLRLKGPHGPILDPRAIPALGLVNPELALAVASEELTRNPRDSTVWSARADVLAELGRWLDAIRDYQTALDLDPGDPGTLNNFAWLLLERAPEGLRNWTEAGALAARALEAAPDNPYVLGTYGTWLLRRGEPTEAAGFLRRALLASRPSVPDATDRYLLATALARAGRLEEATEVLAEAAQADPDNAYRPEAEEARRGTNQRAPAL